LQYWKREPQVGRKLVQSVRLNVRLPRIKAEPISPSVLLQLKHPVDPFCVERGVV
jgi:hypothetical protein